MMLPALLIVVAVFVTLAFVRVGGAERRSLLRHWPSSLLAATALFMALRGAIWPALALAALAYALVALRAPDAAWSGPPPGRSADEAGDREARAILGVGPNATAAEIRAAYRAQMARRHPDKGGAHEDATRLTAARDRLLKGR